MNTIYTVSTANSKRLETLSREEAVGYAQQIYDMTGVIAEIHEHEAEPAYHDCSALPIDYDAEDN